MVTEQNLQSPPVELDPYSIELTRYQKGNFGWVVKIRGKDKAQVWEDLVNLNANLNLQYGTMPAKGE
jgi:hypothetical protein